MRISELAPKRRYVLKDKSFLKQIDTMSMSDQKLSNEQISLLEKLRRRVEETFGIPITTPSRFEALTAAIYNRTGVLLSPTTLKRQWGYIREQVIPRRTTLDVLAQFCGWPDYETFSANENTDIESGNIGSPSIRVNHNISPGERVRLLWPPGRVCVVEYLGSMRWRVVRSEATRLAPGDTFDCAVIISGEPLYLDNLQHAGQRPGVYVCGRRSGVTFVRDE